MAAYVISDVEFLDPPLIERYRSLAQATIAKYGGRYLARGRAVETVEGDWKSARIIIVEFPTMERAREWYNSPEYAEALKVRRTALDVHTRAFRATMEGCAIGPRGHHHGQDH